MILSLILCIHAVIVGIMVWHPSPSPNVMNKGLTIKTIESFDVYQTPKVATPSKRIAHSMPPKKKNVSRKLQKLEQSPQELQSLSHRNPSHIPISEAMRTKLEHSFAMLEQKLPISSSASLEKALVALLQHTLKLPDFGEVKVQLTLHSDGSVAKVKVCHAESAQNRAYIETHLPLLNFREVLGKQKNQDDVTVSIAFCNAL